MSMPLTMWCPEHCWVQPWRSVSTASGPGNPHHPRAESYSTAWILALNNQPSQLRNAGKGLLNIAWQICISHSHLPQSAYKTHYLKRFKTAQSILPDHVKYTITRLFMSFSLKNIPTPIPSLTYIHSLPPLPSHSASMASSSHFIPPLYSF